jgi:catechol 2,3-dioxygenase
MTVLSQSNTEVQTPCGLNHLVLNVRDLDESHRVWTEFLRFRQVGAVRRPNRGGKPRPRMYFYSGEQDGKLRHHDIALVEQRMLPADPAEGPRALNHVAIAYPTREAWDKQISFLARAWCEALRAGRSRRHQQHSPYRSQRRRGRTRL